MNAKQEAQVKRLQDNLLAIRKFAGWTTEELGNEIGVTKQTISNLERRATKMTLAQYYAIRAVLDDEIEQHPENELLKASVTVLLDDDELPEEKQEDLQKQMNLYATAIAGGAKREEMIKDALRVIGPIAASVAVGIATRNPLIASHAWVTMMRALDD